MFDIELYNKELEGIFSRFPMYQQVGKIAYKTGLDGMKAIDKRLGNPHKKFLSIHVAGTNGKGSVSHMLASVLGCAGMKVGLYTSPHLLDFRERIKIGGEMISREFVYDFITKHKSFFEEHDLSFFEITTAMAFDFFASQNVDVAVIETGLGGRLDSTNIINPVLSVITNIGLDHCDHLGFTLGEIAREKAGIIKRDVPVVIGEALPSTKHIFELKAGECNSKIVFAQDYIFKDVKAADYNTDLRGDYQNYNVRTVLTALSVLSSVPSFMNISLGWDDANIREGLSSAAARTGLRGRWEILSNNPKVICDTGHNSHGLKHVFAQLVKEPHKRLFILLGFVADKDLEKILGLLPQNAYYIFSQASVSRALDASKLAERCFSVDLEGVVIPNIDKAIDYFMSVQKEGDILFIGGSTFVVAEAIAKFDN